MRIFQIQDSLCRWDATNSVTSIEAVREIYSPDIVFVEAPDYVREGWGYDNLAEGDARFLRPVPPDGYLYDEETGTFYPDESNNAKNEVETLTETIEKMRAMLAEAESKLAALTTEE